MLFTFTLPVAADGNRRPVWQAMALVCLGLLAWSAGRISAAGENWPQFRGPAGDGMSDATGLPTTFGETENVRWKTPIHGKGWSSPVVWGNQIWLTTAPEDGKQMFAMCVDLKSGEILRDIKLWDIAEPQFCHPYNSYASPTPAIEAGRVYVHFGAHGTAAIDTASGEKVWSRQDLPCNHFRGPGSSPIIVDDLLILTFDGFDYNYLVGLNKHTGETVWRRDRNIDYGTDNGDYHKAFSTPQVIESDGRRQLISPSAGATIAYDPATGDELWRIRSGGMNAAARPLYSNGLAYCIAPAGGFGLFAFKPNGSGDITKQVVWKAKAGRSIPSRGSPILLDGLLYISNDTGIMSAIDALTGESIWTQRHGGNISASPVYADGKIYFFDEDGTAPVLKPGRKYELLAENHLDAGCMASPAVVGHSLIVRTKKELYRIENAN
ncbi:MAG TPA: PQQ-binding-like beta-propeller repeat protein [Pirellulales bacterium]|nr:PQQ-binding-like beta-propeller repeat protein [Pirellulales bacterium]